MWVDKECLREVSPEGWLSCPLDSISCLVMLEVTHNSSSFNSAQYSLWMHLTLDRDLTLDASLNKINFLILPYMYSATTKTSEWEIKEDSLDQVSEVTLVCHLAVRCEVI